MLYTVIEFMGIAPTFIKRKPTKNLNLSKDEEDIFTKYYAFFKYPVGAPDISRVLVIIQLSAFIFAPLLWYKGLIIQAIILAINYFVASSFAVKLNPAHYLAEDIKKGGTKYIEEYALIKSVSDKISYFEEDESVSA